MTPLTQSVEVRALLDRVSGLAEAGGSPRIKAIARRMLGDLYATMDEFDVSPEEFWHALAFLAEGAPEFGLWAPGLGFDRYLDIRMDAADAAAGTSGGTPRTIEGPLYVAGAPLSKGSARMDDAGEAGEVLLIEGRVLGPRGPVAGAIVDVWHASTNGGYSFFDPSLATYAYRRRVETDAQGRYVIRTILPSGYSVPPGGTTERLMHALGRHGARPAHVHFFVSAPGLRHLTTQINIAGDPLLHEDFAQATRDGLIPDLVHIDDVRAIEAAGLNGPFARIAFDFELMFAVAPAEAALMDRPRKAA